MPAAWKDGLRYIVQQLTVPPHIQGHWERVYLTVQDGNMRDQAGMAARQVFCKPFDNINLTPHSGTVGTENTMVPQEVLPTSFFDVRLKGTVTTPSSQSAEYVQTRKISAVELEDGSFVKIMGPFRSNGNWGIKGARIPRQLLSSETLSKQ
jgi:hypothetical protein